MKKIIEKKRITYTYVRLVLDDGYIFEDVYDLLETLENVGEVDGFFERVVIYNDWGKKLEELGVLSKSSKGSYSTGKNFEKFWDEVFMTVYGKERNK